MNANPWAPWSSSEPHPSVSEDDEVSKTDEASDDEVSKTDEASDDEVSKTDEDDEASSANSCKRSAGDWRRNISFGREWRGLK